MARNIRYITVYSRRVQPRRRAEPRMSNSDDAGKAWFCIILGGLIFLAFRLFT